MHPYLMQTVMELWGRGLVELFFSVIPSEDIIYIVNRKKTENQVIFQDCKDVE